MRSSLLRNRHDRVLLRLESCEPRDMPSSSIPLSLTDWTEIGPMPLLRAQTPGNLPATGRASCVAVHPTDPNTIYIGTAGGGVWKTTNGGATNPDWTPLTDDQATCFIGSIALAPSNPNIIYVGTGEAELRDISFYGRGVLKSTDAGATWALLGANHFDRTVISKVVVHPTNPDIVFVSVGGFGTDGNTAQQPGVYRSTDGGLTWTNTTSAITTSVGFSDVDMDPTDVNVLWACAGVRLGASEDGVYKTTNALAPSPTWTLVSNLPSGVAVGRTEFAIAPSNNQVLYVSMQSVSTGGLLGWFSSTNGGASWVDRTSVTPASPDRMWFCNNLLVDPTNPNIVYFSGTTDLGRTTNGGASWTLIATSSTGGANGAGPHVDHHGFALDSLGRFIAVGDGGIYRWTPSPTNLWVSLNGINQGRTASGALGTLQFMGIAISPTDPNFVIGGTQDNGLERFTDSLGWTLPEGGDGGDVIIDPFNEQRMWRANPVRSFGESAFVRRSTNGGETWTSIVNGITNALNTTAFYPPMAADPGTQNRIFLGATTLYVSTNGGNNWGSLPGGNFVFPNTIRAIGIGPASASTIYVACGAALNGTVNAANADQVFVTTNNGATWVERTPQLGGDFQAFAVDPNNSNIAYVVSANFSPTGDNIWRTTDAGATWTSISSALPDAPFYDVLLDPGPTTSPTDDVLFASGDLGVYRSANLGAKWSKFGNGLPIAQVRDIEYSPQTRILAAGTHGRGVWEILTGPPPGEIFGTIYQDSNANGILNPGEPGLPGWTVYRDDNNNGAVDSYGTVTLSAPGTPLTLPDLMTTNSTLPISGISGVVTDVNVQINISHTSVGQLQLFLTSPAGTMIPLAKNVGGTGDHFNGTIFDDEAVGPITSGSAPFAGTFYPWGSLAAFDVQSPNGNWTLTVIDGTSGTSGTLNNWSITLTTGESSTTTISDGSYVLRNNVPGTYTIRRVLQSGWFGTAPVGGANTVTLSAAAGTLGVNFGQTMTPPARVASTLVNGSTAQQRSRVTSIQITFDAVVTFAGGSAGNAFTLTRNGGGAVSFVADSNVVGGVTVVTLNNFTGLESDSFGSLRDGRFTLTALAGNIGAAGIPLDGNGDGIAGDNYIFGGAQGLFRFFGDANGDRQVDGLDFGLFVTTYGLLPSQAGFLAYFDINGDGRIDGSDFGQFVLRYNSVLP